jgi:hypothetical protein
MLEMRRTTRVPLLPCDAVGQNRGMNVGAGAQGRAHLEAFAQGLPPSKNLHRFA